MKVLFVNLYDDPAAGGVGGGVEVTLYHLTQGLLRRGVEPVFLATSAQKGLHQAERDGVRIWRAGLGNIYWPDMKSDPHPALRALWHMMDSYKSMMQPLLRRVLEIERPNVVSIHNLFGWSAAAWCTIDDKGIPSVQVLNSFYAMCPKSTMYREGSGNCARQCISCSLLRLAHRGLSRRVSAVARGQPIHPGAPSESRIFYGCPLPAGDAQCA